MDTVQVTEIKKLVDEALDLKISTRLCVNNPKGALVKLIASRNKLNEAIKVLEEFLEE